MKQLHWRAGRVLVLLALGLAPLGAQGVPMTTDTLEAAPQGGDPPFSGTIFIDPDIITEADPTTLVDAPYAGQGNRVVFDRRVNDWVNINAYLFNATFSDGLTAEIQVNPEFGSSSAAETAALFYAEAIGRIPYALRVDVQSITIHQGVNPFGGGNNNLLIHTGQGALYSGDGILEETFVHEAAHTSLDAAHAAAPGWLNAQTADGNFISTYARDYPDREDVAESFLPWLAVRLRAGRITPELAQIISDTIPNRMAYFDGLGLNLAPVGPEGLMARDDVVLTVVNVPALFDPRNNDTDSAENPIAITAVGTPQHGVVDWDSSFVVYTPDTDFVGTDVFTYTASTVSASQTATVTVQVLAELYPVYLPLVVR